MWSCDLARAGRGLRLGMAALILAAAAGCTAGPLYGDRAADFGAPGAVSAAALRGRIAVAPAEDRMTQIVRNKLLFDLNGGDAVREPLYEVGLTVNGAEVGVSIESGSGVPTASIFQVTVSYQVVRLSDSKVIATGKRQANAPFDRSAQLFAAERAAYDARQKAGETAASLVELDAVARIRRDVTG